MIRLYLIRHGETDWNKERRFQGWTDLALNDNGISQAVALGERFKNTKIDEIYSSPLNRAMKTAEGISKAIGKEIILNEKFKEINFGEWEGLTASEISKKYGKDFDDFMLKPEGGTFPGEISFDAVTERVKEGLDSILKDKDNMNIVIVSHGGIVRLIIKYLMGFSGEWYNKTWIDNTAISVVEIREKGNLLRLLNDCAHIETGIF